MINKNAYKTIVLILMGLIVHTALASDSEIDRPQMMSETLYSDNYYTDPPSDALVWTKTLLDLKVPDFSPQSDLMNEFNGCNYKSALLTLHEIQKQLGPKSNYVKIWASNQVKVLAACEEPSESEQPPVRPKMKSMPKRTESDYIYQLASWNFYKNKYQTALDKYKIVEKMPDAPQRANAAYMVVRSLAYLNKAEDAYHKIDKILSDPSLKKIHDMARNYRFVIMSNTRSFDMDITPSLAKKHLDWLQKIVRLKKDPGRNADLLFADQKEALEQFNLYFPLYAPDTMAVDWWLSSDIVENPRMRAVKTLALKMPFIDWTQAKWSYNVFDDDWLWALHEKANPYWGQNRNIVAHALEQWKKTGDGVWLQIAIKRVHPMDNESQQILAIAEPYLDRSWQKETPEYRLWLFDLWKNVIRIQLGKGETDIVENFIVKYKDFYMSGLLTFPESKEYAYTRYDFLSVLSESLKWLVYTGQIEKARSFLGIFKTHYHNDFYKWRSLLATNMDDAICVALDSDLSFSDFLKDDSVWRNMMNLMPSKFLYTIASDERIKIEKRALIARSLLTRAILLEYDNDQLDKYAVLAAKLNPSIREQILESLERHDRNKYISLLLRIPRFRPAVFLEYAQDPQNNGTDKIPAIDAIDIYNHNDNNWWCRFDDEEFRTRTFNSMVIVPVCNAIFSSQDKKSPGEQDLDNDQEYNEEGSELVDGEPEIAPDIEHHSAEQNLDEELEDNAEEPDQIEYKKEFEPYLENQKKLLDQHPYMILVDSKEIDAMKCIPSGPQYLSEAVIMRELESKPAITTEEQNERAADLHRAIRTTRYGCNQNSSHGKYSRQAYILLHKTYENTSWAKATPYWFE